MRPPLASRGAFAGLAAFASSAATRRSRQRALAIDPENAVARDMLARAADGS